MSFDWESKLGNVGIYRLFEENSEEYTLNQSVNS